MKDSLILVPIWNMEIDEDLGGGVACADWLSIAFNVVDPVGHWEDPANLGETSAEWFRLTNHKERIAALLTPAIRECLGVRAAAIEQAPMVIYFQHSDGHPCEDTPMGHMLERSLLVLSDFLNVLWVLQDNAVNINFGVHQMEVGTEEPMVRMQDVQPCFRNAMGEINPTRFTSADISTCLALFSRLTSHRLATGSKQRSIETPIIVSSRRSGRIERMISFLGYARAASDLGVKIVNYCTSLEILFSTDSSEIAHKVAERVAIFIESDPDLRINTYEAIKKAYNVRSRVIHGDTLGHEAITDLPDTSVKLGFILRRVFGRILSDDALINQFEGSRKSLEGYFMDLTLRLP